MTPKLITTLLELGLRENEANLYLTGLKLGATTILELSRESDIKRSTIYGIIENLKSKGLCWEQMDGWKKLYAMSVPTKLTDILEAKKLELDKVLPEFEALVNLDQNDSSIEYYKGLEGIKIVYQKILENIKNGGFHYIMGDLQPLYDLDLEFIRQHIAERAKISQKYDYSIKAIFNKSSASINNQAQQKKLNMKIKLVDFGVDISNIILTKDFLFIQQLSQPIHGIIIKNSGAIKAQKVMFEMLWQKL